MNFLPHVFSRPQAGRTNHGPPASVKRQTGISRKKEAPVFVLSLGATKGKQVKLIITAS
jgi:hypothetical protein